jgi:hypothetical protein
VLALPGARPLNRNAPVISVITTLIRIVPDTVTTLPIRYPVIPFGVALARSSVPSSRSIVKMPPSVAIPLKPTFMPIMLASMAVPSEKRVPGTVVVRVHSMTVSRIAVKTSCVTRSFGVVKVCFSSIQPRPTPARAASQPVFIAPPPRTS